MEIQLLTLLVNTFLIQSTAIRNVFLMPSHIPVKKLAIGSVTFSWNQLPTLSQASLILSQHSMAFAFTVPQFLTNRTTMAIRAPIAATTSVIGEVNTVIAVLNSHVAAVAARVAA